ncbi:MAG: ribosome biogenesis GTPase Der [Desulfurivibrionaceae bacterium]
MEKEKQLPIVALVGRPNVGKSTLFNRLTRSKKAIVDQCPGVTRDRHYEMVKWRDRHFTLIDTGGIELGKEDEMISHIQEQTWQAVNDADLIILLLDGREGMLRDDYEVVDYLRRNCSKPVFHVVNKIDSPEKEEEWLAQFYELGVEDLWPLSAEHGYGFNDFFDYLIDSLPYPEETWEIPEDMIRIACIGRPNAGKSTLINCLVGQERMVVSEIPGTTRDSVDTVLEKKGRRYLLIDTAGIRRKGKVKDKVEKFSVMHALSAMERAEIALFLVDGEEGITEQDTKVIGYGLERGRACILLINKWDLVKGDHKREKRVMAEVSRATRFMEYAPSLKISALDRSGTGKILSLVNTVHYQYGQTFTTNRLNNVLQNAVKEHTPPFHKGSKLKFYYTTQVSSGPPTFIVFVNYPKGVHFSYHRYLVNQFRQSLGLDKVPVKVILKERQRR